MPDPIIHPASFRDPSGFVFQWNGKIYRQVNKIYAEDYDLLMNSGLYKHLTEKKLLIEHSETDEIIADPTNRYKTLLPLQLHHISYPYEWCFDQLKDAALLTISILKEAVDHGMIIKDATPYNIQFYKCVPVFIDTLSFEKYDADNAWVAYRQFCNMFLFPLYLEHYLRTDIQKTLVVYPDGIPVDITSKLLPLRSRTSLGVWLHVYLQNTVSRSTDGRKDGGKFNRRKLMNLVDHLERTIANIKSRYRLSEWNNYYGETISSKEYLGEKEKIFREMMTAAGSGGPALDLGANDGYFSKILAANGYDVVAIDNDSQSIQKLYNETKATQSCNITPLVIDIANPSPATGFNNRERPGFHERFGPNLVIALALVHHLVIGRNVSLRVLASWFGDISEKLIIEFVPKQDEKVQLMLASRKDVFDDYTAEHFEEHFLRYFTIKRREPIPGSQRVIYLMEKR
ncbi:MAG: hypothetical protein JNK79_07885 [Chitinophagaceae bacterium]|nr:hypothetical protein [Chitinophagaceae bacterium]